MIHRSTGATRRVGGGASGGRTSGTIQPVTMETAECHTCSRCGTYGVSSRAVCVGPIPGVPLSIAELLDFWWIRVGLLPLSALVACVGARLFVIRTGQNWRLFEPEAWLISPDLVVLSFMTLLTGLVEAARAIERSSQLLSKGVISSTATHELSAEITALENKQTVIALALVFVAVVGILGLLVVRYQGYRTPPRRHGRAARPTVMWSRGVVIPNAVGLAIFAFCLAISRVP